MFSFPSSTNTSRTITTQKTSIDVKVCYQQLVRQVHVDDPSRFKIPNLMKIANKFPGLKSTTFNLEYIPSNNNNNQRVIIDSEEVLVTALTAAISTLSLKIFVIPLSELSRSASSLQDEVESHNSSEFELMDYFSGSESDVDEVSSDNDGEDDMSGTIVVPSEMSIIPSTSDEEIDEECIDDNPPLEEEESENNKESYSLILASSSQLMDLEKENEKEDESKISRVLVGKSSEEKEVLPYTDIPEHSVLANSSPFSEEIGAFHALFGENHNSNSQKLSNDNPSLRRLQEILSNILSDHEVISELQQILAKNEVKQFVSDVLRAEREGKDVWEVASPYSIHMVELMSEVSQKLPKLLALIPVIIALSMDAIANKTKAESDDTKKSTSHDQMLTDNVQNEKAIEDIPLEDAKNDNTEEIINQAAEEESSYIANEDDDDGSYEEIEAESVSELVNNVEPLKLLQCPQYHDLKGFGITINKYVCDLCGTRPGSKQLMFGCRECDFDICIRCAEHIAGPMVRMMKFGCPSKHELKEHVAIHSGFACNNCFIRPEPGTIMHGCRVCNYDQCVACYNKSILKCLDDSRKDATSMISNSKQYQAICIRSVTYPDGSVLSPRQVFTKVWIMKNTSQEPWAEGTRLVPVGGERFDFPIDGIVISPLGPDECGEISLRLTAPLGCNRYIVYFGLVTPDGERFGDRIWVDISVNGTTGEQIMATISQPLRSISDTIKSKVNHLELRDKVSASANTILSQIPNMLNSFVTNYSDNDDSDSLEETSQNKVNENSDDLIKKYSNEMQSLVEMGFDDIEKNTQLLERFNGSVNDILAEMFQDE